MPLNSFVYTLVAVACVYAALSLYLFVMQPRLIYHPLVPTRALEATPAALGLDYNDIALETSDGETLHAWYIPHGDARRTLLFAHGNAGNISHRLDSIQLFHELGLNVLIFDYRGYGNSSGKTTEAGTYRDIDAAWSYLATQRKIAPADIVIFGRSLGAAVAAELAARVDAGAVILESAFLSVPAMAKRIYPWLPAHWIASYRYDNGAKVGRIQSPILIVHSRGDEIIPFEQGERLFQLANQPKQFLELRGGHNDGFDVSRRLYRETLAAFLADKL